MKPSEASYGRARRALHPELHDTTELDAVALAIETAVTEERERHDNAHSALRRAYTFIEQTGGDVGDLLSQIRAAGERVGVGTGEEGGGK